MRYQECDSYLLIKVCDTDNNLFLLTQFNIVLHYYSP